MGNNIGANLSKIQAIIEMLKERDRLDRFDREDAEAAGPKDNIEYLPVPRHRLPTPPSQRDYLERKAKEELERKRKNNILLAGIKKKPTTN